MEAIKKTCRECHDIMLLGPENAYKTVCDYCNAERYGKAFGAMIDRALTPSKASQWLGSEHVTKTLAKFKKESEV